MGRVCMVFLGGAAGAILCFTLATSGLAGLVVDFAAGLPWTLLALAFLQFSDYDWSLLSRPEWWNFGNVVLLSLAGAAFINGAVTAWALDAKTPLPRSGTRPPRPSARGTPRGGDRPGPPREP